MARESISFSIVEEFMPGLKDGMALCDEEVLNVNVAGWERR